MCVLLVGPVPAALKALYQAVLERMSVGLSSVSSMPSLRASQGVVVLALCSCGMSPGHSQCDLVRAVKVL